MHCGIDGVDYFTDPSRPMFNATVGPVFNFRSNIGSITSTATTNMDNIRVYRGEP